ncbi:TPA: hypothetical protein ACK3JP_002151 [Mannheimia haemolytica]|uniref:hypothetical protein n=1 Tax=Mannheimia haemolytica TaxID=75985 RepID=UPI0035B21F80
MPQTTREIIGAWEEVAYLLNISEEKDKPFQEVEKIIEKREKLSKLLTSYLVNRLDDKSKDKIYNHFLEVRNTIIQNGFKNSPNLLTLNTNGIKDILYHLNQIELQFKDLDFFELYSDLYDKNQQIFDSVYEEKKKEITDWLAYKTGEDISSIFEENKNQIDFVITGQYLLFFVILILVCCIGFNFISNEINSINFKNTGYSILILLSKYIFIIPLLWVALFVSKRLVENRKIYHTYLHKEVAAKSYINYLEYIKNNPIYFENGQETHDLLLKNTIETLGINPALLLDKTTAEKIPTEELMMKLVDKIQTKN